jgi:hypothetical protein
LAPKRNGQANGNSASVGLKAAAVELHCATVRASPAAGGIQRLLDPDLFADPQVAATPGVALLDKPFTELALLARVREALVGNL